MKKAMIVIPIYKHYNLDLQELREEIMILKAVLFCSYLLLKAVLDITTFLYPTFKGRLKERDLSFAVKMKTNPAAGLFRLKEGKLSFKDSIEGFINFTAVWNGWGNADTLRKKMHLNLFDYLNTGMITVEGDISSMDYLLVILGEMIKCFKESQPSALRRAELKKEPE